MFAFKKKYFLLIESIKDINIRNLKKYNKFTIIYRNNKTKENFNQLLKFRKQCKLKLADFYVANDKKLAVSLGADGIYLSSYNTNLDSLYLRRTNFKIIGSAHNVNEIRAKKLQGCSIIIFSRLFKTSYQHKKGYLGIIRYNLMANSFRNQLIPLGGIKISNLNKLKNVKCDAFTIFSEVKKKPAIIDRLF